MKKYRKMKGLENSPFANIIVIHVSGKNLQWMLKLLGEIVVRIGYFLPVNFLLITKGKRATLQWRKPTHPPWPSNQR